MTTTGREQAELLHQFSKHLVRQWEAEGRTLSALAAAMGVSVGFLSQVKSDRSRMGLEPLASLAVASRMTLLQLFTRADEWARSGASSTSVIRPERYPNLGLAVEYAQRSRLPISPAAIDRVRSMGLRSDTDETPEWWLEELRSVEREIQREGPTRPAAPPAESAAPTEAAATRIARAAATAKTKRDAARTADFEAKAALKGVPTRTGKPDT